MFFKFPIRTIVQEDHGGTSLPYNNIRHGMYSLYKVMNRAGANRESLLPYAQAPMKKKSTENAAPMSARHYESENARRDASAQTSPRLPHARGQTGQSWHNMRQTEWPDTMPILVYVCGTLYTFSVFLRILFVIFVSKQKFIITLCSWFSPFFRNKPPLVQRSRIQYFNLLNPFHQVIAQILIR